MLACDSGSIGHASPNLRQPAGALAQGQEHWQDGCGVGHHGGQLHHEGHPVDGVPGDAVCAGLVAIKF